MKNLYCVLSFLIVLVLSCSKDSLLNSDQSPDQLLNNSTLKASGLVIPIYPNNADDTPCLIDAFAQAKASGQKAVVKLMPGTFKIGMIEVKEFNGTLTGSGKVKTIITNLPGLTPDAVIQNNKLPALITFIGGDVSVSDLTIQLTEELPWIGTYEMNMLLFSDFSADFMPKTKHIQVNLNNIEIIGILHLYYPWGNWLCGAKFAPDMKFIDNTPVPRCNINATIANSKFSKFNVGVFVWGCKSGNLNFGTTGSNIFTENYLGLSLAGNIGVTVKIMNNEFNAPTYSFNALDISSDDVTGPQPLEPVQKNVGTYEIRKNFFNTHSYSTGVGLWDNWRYAHPENPDWMKMIWEYNTFNNFAAGADVAMFGLKNAVFSNNKFVGDAQGGYLRIWGSWLSPDQPGYALKVTENCKFLNNLFLQEDFVIELGPKTKDCLIVGDLSNVIIIDNGVNNKVIRTKN